METEYSSFDKPIIERFLRIDLPAKHLPTNAIVWFPMIHVLVERVKHGFIATCLEYSQSFESTTMNEAVTGLTQIMYRFFFSVLKKEGQEYLYQHARNTENDHLWAAVREFSARQHALELNFIEQSFKNTSKADLEQLAAALKSTPPLEGRFITHATHDSMLKKKDQDIEALKAALQDLAAKSAELAEENRKLRFGLEGHDEWKEELEQAKINISSSL